VLFAPSVTGSQNGVLTVNSTDASVVMAQLTGVGISYEFLPTSATTVSVTSGHAASYSLELVPVSGSAGTANLSCSNLPPNSTCTLNPATASLLAPSNIQVAIATGVGTPKANKVEARRAGMAAALPWPVALLLLLLPLWIIRCRRKAFQNSLLILLLLITAIAGITACGKGGGPLGAASNPLPALPVTPSGTYMVTVTAVAGGLQKSVGLTLQVQ
jgi:hypothetical protein